METKLNKKASFKTTLVLIFVLVVLGVSFFLFTSVGDSISSRIIENKEKEQENYNIWLSENCKCLEHERLKCREGYELGEDGMCVNSEEKTFTNPLEACSRYECSDGIVFWNNETWQKEAQ